LKLATTHLEQVVTALKAAARAAEEGGDRRRHARVQLVGRVNVRETPGRQYTALLHDISYDGVRILQAHAPVPNAQLVFSVPRGKRPPLELLCTVTRVVETASGLYTVGCSYERVVEKPAEVKK
jgi:hypothetical protein